MDRRVHGYHHVPEGRHVPDRARAERGSDDGLAAVVLRCDTLSPAPERPDLCARARRHGGRERGGVVRARAARLFDLRSGPIPIKRHTDGYYYFTASVPTYDRIEIRRATTMRGLASATPKDVLDQARDLPDGRIWAPSYLRRWQVVHLLRRRKLDQHLGHSHVCARTHRPTRWMARGSSEGRS